MIVGAESASTPWRDRARSDDGLVTVWVLAVLPVVIGFFAVGLALWSGYATRQHLSQMAEAAARSGANAIDETVFNETGEVTLVEESVILLATETLAIQPDRERLTGGSVSVVDDQVFVVVVGEVSLLGLGSVGIEVDATAEPRLDRATVSSPSTDVAATNQTTSP